MYEDQEPQEVLNNATTKAVLLSNILHSKDGDKLYRLLGFHRQNTQPPMYQNMFSN